MSTTALAARPETAVAAVESRGFITIESFEQAIKVADYIQKSALVPDAYRGKPADIVIAMQYGMELGLSPMQALWSVAIINGRPTVWGDALPGIVMAWGGDLRELAPEGDAPDKWFAACTVLRPGKTEKTATFTWAQAKRAGLVGKKGPWETYPERMLKMRARGFAVRDAYPDRLKGMITAEEAHDLPVIDIAPSEPRRREPAPSSTSSPSAPPAADDASARPAAVDMLERLEAAKDAAPATTSQAPAAAPAPSPDQIARGAKVLNTSVITDDRGDLYEIETSRGVYYTRERGLYEEAATCEGTPTLLAITWRPAKRKKNGKLEPMRALIMLALDEEGGAS